MKSTELWELLLSFENGDISIAETHDAILILFDHEDELPVNYDDVDW